MTVAYELSRGDWREDFESITVYQYGWRLGGKGASGRGRHGRIEEHGLHIWLGFYDNAFRMLRECYEELGRGPDSPIRDVESAFERASVFVIQEPVGDAWLPWVAEFPETDEMPGVDPAIDPALDEAGALWSIMLRALRLVASFNRSGTLAPGRLAELPEVRFEPVPAAGGDGPPSPPPAIHLSPVPPTVLDALGGCLESVYERLRDILTKAHDFELAAALAVAETLDPDPAGHDPDAHRLLTSLLEEAGTRLRARLGPTADLSDGARRDWYLCDILIATFRGLLADGVFTHPDGLRRLDDEDFADWLLRHGAHPEAARCGFVTTLMYDLPFAYRDGDPAQPSIAAGVALLGALRILFTSTGAVAWKMRAGMGDVVFAPLFEVLERRGVRFEFFHRVESLHLDETRTRVESVRLTRQALLCDPSQPYRPLVEVAGLPCWPNAPLAEQLTEPLTATDAESFWSRKPPAGPPVVLRDGADFDQLVLAIPVGAHPYVCEELLEADARWRAMAERLETVYTQAFQVWLSAGPDELGAAWPAVTSGGYYEPFDTYADMRQLIGRECWAPGQVGSIAYFCNVMPTPRGLPSREDRALPVRAATRVKANAIAFLEQATGELWPGGVERYPDGFRWELLVDDEERSGPARFDAQFWRANVDPSERYVLSLPGTTRYRLAPDESGFANLTLAGDWTRCGLDSGCVEAAVTSGLLAAHHLRPASARRLLGELGLPARRSASRGERVEAE